jgi:hypothetical protein
MLVQGLLKVLGRLVLRLPMAAMRLTPTMTAIRPASIAVAPDPSLTKRDKALVMMRSRYNSTCPLFCFFVCALHKLNAATVMAPGSAPEWAAAFVSRGYQWHIRSSAASPGR